MVEGVADIATLPGSEIVVHGIEHLREGHVSPEALLVSMLSRRLRHLGWDVPDPLDDPERRLWDLLAATDSDQAHSRYNALVRRLDRFCRAVACAS